MRNDVGATRSGKDGIRYHIFWTLAIDVNVRGRGGDKISCGLLDDEEVGRDDGKMGAD